MSNYKRGLIVAIALLTVVGMTAVFAAPTGASITSGDGLTSTFDSLSDASANAENNDSDDHPACDNPGNSDNNSANCTDKDEDDEEDEEDDENEEDDDNEEDEEDEGGEDAGGTCETGGAAQNNTFANEAFGTENESGPISSQIHANEEQFQDAEPVVHEVSCGVATIDNNAAGNDSDDGGDGGDGNESNPAQDLIDELEDNAPGNESDDGDGDDGDDGGDGEMGSCETGGAAQNNTIANEAFGTENESGPISSQFHENEEQFQDGEPLAHEVSCGVATVDNNAS